MLEWNQTALIATILANANRDSSKQKEPFKFTDFHPMGKEIEQSSSKHDKVVRTKQKFHMEEVRHIISKGMGIPL